MNDKQIEAFLTICKTGSMNRAAEKLYISQPALKKRMDALEGELSVALLERSSEGCVPTQAGRLFLEGITPIFEQLTQLAVQVREHREQKTLRVCTLPDISLEGQDRVLIAFAQENPDILIEWVPLPTSLWIDAVAEGKADMCGSLYIEGMSELFGGKRVRFYPSDYSTQTVCVISSKHPLAKKDALTMRDFAGCKVYAGPLLYYCGGLKEYAQSEGVDIAPDDNAGKRYKVIEQCERGGVYIHAGDYAGSLRPLVVRPILDFTCRSCWVFNENCLSRAERFLRFMDKAC